MGQITTMPYKFILENNGRDELVNRIQEISGENTKAGAIDRALAHYVQDYRQKQRLVTELDRDTAERLSTSEMPIEAPDPQVGPFDE